jgi:hypothetical protein
MINREAAAYWITRSSRVMTVVYDGEGIGALRPATHCCMCVAHLCPACGFAIRRREANLRIAGAFH